MELKIVDLYDERTAIVRQVASGIQKLIEYR